jgi:hypothetical protein
MAARPGQSRASQRRACPERRADDPGRISSADLEKDIALKLAAISGPRLQGVRKWSLEQALYFLLYLLGIWEALTMFREEPKHMTRRNSAAALQSRPKRTSRANSMPSRHRLTGSTSFGLVRITRHSRHGKPIQSERSRSQSSWMIVSLQAKFPWEDPAVDRNASRSSRRTAVSTPE